MSELLTIRGLIERVLSGIIRVPKFQRGFVWEPGDVAFLMDSIYRGYPIGSVLFWRSTEQLAGERTLGPFELPEPAKKWPVDYILDGQQRLTSLFGVFQTALKPAAEIEHFEIYFDLGAPEGALEEQFVARHQGEQIETNLFPMRLLFDPTSFALRTRDMNSHDLGRVVELQRRFQEAQIKNEVIEFENREQIAMIFERINRAGVPLDTFQLLTAWTWSEEFDLNERIENLGAEVAPYGFSRIGAEQDLLLKCAAAVLTGDASVRSIVALHGPTVRARFDVIERGILGAIEFLRSELNVHSLEIMPYPAMLVPLCRFFATDAASGIHPTAAQRATLIKWFWRCCFSRRYSSGVGKAHEADIRFMDQLKANEATVINLSGDAEPEFFIFSNFNVGSVNTKVFILLLASRNPRSLLSNAQINLEDVLLRCNRNEFHHIFPKNYLGTQTQYGTDANMLANFCFLSAADNQKIKDRAPALYISLIKDELRADVEEISVLPPNWFKLEFPDFATSRAELLEGIAETLCGESVK